MRTGLLHTLQEMKALCRFSSQLAVTLAHFKTRNFTATSSRFHIINEKAHRLCDMCWEYLPGPPRRHLLQTQAMPRQQVNFYKG